MDFHDHEDEMGNIPPPGYESIPNNNTNNSARSKHDGASTAARKHAIRYRECLKNHAVGIGGHAVDGCGEFLAAGEEGTLDGLRCAACDCHRNFHRKETDGGGGGEPMYSFSPYYRPPAGYLHLTPPAQHRPLALPAASAGGGGHSRDDEDMSNPSSSGGSKKRFRTKFTADQKEKMLGFAERLGWRIQKHDEAAVEQFCSETGVRRHVLKVWMHNNKHTLGKKP